MRRLVLVICFAVVAVPGHAQIGPKELTLAAVSDCIKDAIATSSVEGNGPVIFFSCSSTKAKTLFGFLGRKVPVAVVQDKNGKFENRPFGNDNACYHRIEEPDGKAADDFHCDLILTIGDALSD